MDYPTTTTEQDTQTQNIQQQDTSSGQQISTPSSQGSGLLQVDNTQDSLYSNGQPLTDQTPDEFAIATKEPSEDQLTVESRLTNLLQKDNPYLTVARESAKRQANARGLLNTSIAASSGEKAAIEAALPIAQQDANYYQEKGLQGQQGLIQSGLYTKQGEISSGLSKQQYEQEAALKESAYEQEKALKEAEYKQETALKQADIEWNKLELNAKMQVEYDNLDQSNKDRFDNTMNSISDSYMQDYLEIMLNPNFEGDKDRQAAIDILNEVTQNRYEIAGQIAGIELDWGDSAAMTPA
jgi:hypothetical protein